MGPTLQRSAYAFMAVVLAGLVGVSTSRPEPAGDPRSGKARYEQYCVVCHGARGLGNGPMAKATNPPAARLTSPEVRNKSDRELLDVIADGKGTGMPAWRGILSDQDLLDMVAYLRSLGG